MNKEIAYLSYNILNKWVMLILCIISLAFLVGAGVLFANDFLTRRKTA